MPLSDDLDPFSTPDEQNRSAAGATMSPARRAYQATVPELLALAPEEILHVNVNVSVAGPALLTALPGLRDLAPRLRALPEFDAELALNLERYLLALMQADANLAGAARVGESRQELLTRARALGKVLRLEAEAQRARGTLPAAELRLVPIGTGYHKCALRLTGLSHLLRRHATLDGRAALTADVAEAERLAERLLVAGSARREPQKSRAEALRLRNCAFTLFFRSYTQARRAVSFLFWEPNQADRVLPSLYGLRRAKRARSRRR